MAIFKYNKVQIQVIAFSIDIASVNGSETLKISFLYLISKVVFRLFLLVETIKTGALVSSKLQVNVGMVMCFSIQSFFSKISTSALENN